jgi:hypothetical protein
MPYQTGLKDEIEVTANASMNIAVVTQSMQLIKGTTYMMPRDVAHELERAGYVSVSTPEAGNSAVDERDGVDTGVISFEAETATLESPEKAIRRKAVKRRGL